MRRALARLGVAVLATAALLAVWMPGVALADGGNDQDHSSKREKFSFYDSRETPEARQTLRERSRRDARSPNARRDELREQLGSEGVVSIDPLTSTPRHVGRLDDFLTGPSSAPAASIALGWVKANGAALGLDAATVDGMTLRRDYVDIEGIHHLFFVQTANGVPVFGNGLKANVTADGRLVNVLGSPVAAPSLASTSPSVSASGAAASARRDVEAGAVPFKAISGQEVTRPTVFANGDRAELVAFQTVGGLRLAWQTYVSGNTGTFVHVVDAANGRVLYRRSLVNYADGLVIENYPGAPSGGTQEQKSISRPGWLTSSSTLSGNNTHVYADVDDSNDSTNVLGETEEIAPSNAGGDYLYELQRFTFAGPLNSIYGCDAWVCTWNPSFVGDPAAGDPSGDFSYQVNQNQSGTQLFYAINKFHDHLAAPPIGFTEAAGNFQMLNSSGQGLGGDPVLGEALDGANSYGFGFPDPNHTDNANMATPPDGFSPRMQMYLWHDTTDDFFNGPANDPFLPADGSNDVGIVYHEYTHGLSNRLVVDAFGNSTLGNIQAGAMGEAWSDWYALDLLVKDGYAADTSADGELRIGDYVGKGQDLIRTQPLDCAVGSTSPKCPGTPGAGPGGYTYGDFGKIIGRPQVHADGEIWSSTLWDLRGALDTRKAESLVTRAMELSPANPSFLDMRNAILFADLCINSGRNRDAIWRVFAKRGMGYFAAAVDGDDALPVEDFSLPPGRRAKKGNVSGNVKDADTNRPIDGAVVAFGGHASGFPGDFADATNRRGVYRIRRVFQGVYPKVSAKAPGYDTQVVTINVDDRRIIQNFALRRDWAALGGGGSVTAFNGPDFTPFGCGPTGAIDQSLGSGWGSTTDDDAGSETGNVTPKFIVVRLPQPVNASEIQIDPSNTCGDAGSASTKDYRLESSVDGTTWSLVSEGSFGVANRGRLNPIALPAGGLPGIQYLRFTMLNPQVPLADGTLPPFGSSGVPDRCGPTAPNPGNFSGCAFMDMVELAVYGTPA